MFGELIGLWMAAVWKQMGAPENVRVDRARPRPRHHDEGRAARGQGDAGLPRGGRAASGRDQPGAAGAAGAHARATAGADVLASRRSRGAARARPSSSPTNSSTRCRCNQAVKTERGWHERQVEIDAAGNLAFALAPSRSPHFERLLPHGCAPAPPAIDLRMARRHGGDGTGPAARPRRRRRAGRSTTATPKAPPATRCRRSASHAYADPLTAPGSIDLTAHVDFQALAQARWRRWAPASFGPIEQARFPAPARHRDARGNAQGQGRAAPPPPTSTPRWRG